jgi:hypothetical protein
MPSKDKVLLGIKKFGVSEKKYKVKKEWLNVEINELINLVFSNYLMKGHPIVMNAAGSWSLLWVKCILHKRNVEVLTYSTYE